MTYSKNSNTITAYIRYSDFYRKNKQFYNNILNDINARDFGYNYSYMNKYENLYFRNEQNMSNNILPTRSFYHKGYACKLPTGCNNVSPYIREYEFYLTDLPASLNIKLWKEHPITSKHKEDLNFRMIFD